MDKIFDYEDVQLIPNRCIVNSRSECDTSISLGQHKFKLPVVPANMQTIIDESLALKLAKAGYFYIMHRFNPETRLTFIEDMHTQGCIASISVGVKAEEFDFVEQCAKQDLVPEFITIDIAHGHAPSVVNMIKHIKKVLPTSFVIAGNVGTPQAVIELEQAGADAIKVGIGTGKVCITKLKTGFGTAGWQLAALRWCAKAATKPIIADGGLRTNGDIAKSLRFGATMVMMGSMFAAHEESPGQRININGVDHKEYFGSASEYQKGERKNVEGKKIHLQSKGSIFDTLKEMQEDLQSSISYAGGNTLNALKTVDYVIVKNAVVID
jgi:GMP reductase